MRSLIAILSLWTLAAAQDQMPGKFQDLNPGYRDRAAKFYRQEYLERSAGSLVQTVALPRFAREDAVRVLDRLILDYLEAYVEGEGEISRAGHAAVIKRADESMKALLDDGAAFVRWADWRKSADRILNPLAFLTSPSIALAGLAPVLPDEFAREGWSLRSLEDDDQIAAYRRFFPMLPHQVLVVESERGDRLALIVFRPGFRGDRVADLLAALEKSKDPDVRAFWRTSQFMVFAAEKGSVPELLKEQLRRQLARK